MTGGEFVIRGKHYPMVDNISLGDAMFIEAASGLELEDFSARLDAWKEQADNHEMKPGDMRVMVDMIASAVSRVERDWTPRKVAQFVWEVDADTELVIVPPERKESESPLEAGTEEDSPTSSVASTTSAEPLEEGVPV